MTGFHGTVNREIDFFTVSVPNTVQYRGMFTSVLLPKTSLNFLEIPPDLVFTSKLAKLVSVGPFLLDQKGDQGGV